MVRSFAVALMLSIGAATLSGCGVPDIVAHGVKAYNKSDEDAAANNRANSQSQPNYSGNSFQSLPPVRNEDPNLVEPVTSSGREGVTVEKL